MKHSVVSDVSGTQSTVNVVVIYEGASKTLKDFCLTFADIVKIIQ